MKMKYQAAFSEKYRQTCPDIKTGHLKVLRIWSTKMADIVAGQVSKKKKTLAVIVALAALLVLSVVIFTMPRAVDEPLIEMETEVYTTDKPLISKIEDFVIKLYENQHLGEGNDLSEETSGDILLFLTLTALRRPKI